jgi:hypothetical protein
MYPLVEFAHTIGKNTQELTTNDMVNFMKWWMKQPDKIEREDAILQQLGRVKEIHNQSQTEKKENKMSKKHNLAAFQNAQRSRLSPEHVQEIEQDQIAAELGEGSEVDEQEVVLEQAGENIANMELTRLDVDALLFAINTIFSDYDMTGHDYEASLLSLKEGLDGLE